MSSSGRPKLNITIDTSGGQIKDQEGNPTDPLSTKRRLHRSNSDPFHNSTLFSPKRVHQSSGQSAFILPQNECRSITSQQSDNSSQRNTLDSSDFFPPGTNNQLNGNFQSVDSNLMQCDLMSFSADISAMTSQNTIKITKSTSSPDLLITRPNTSTATTTIKRSPKTTTKSMRPPTSPIPKNRSSGVSNRQLLSVDPSATSSVQLNSDGQRLTRAQISQQQKLQQLHIPVFKVGTLDAESHDIAYHSKEKFISLPRMASDKRWPQDHQPSGAVTGTDGAGGTEVDDNDNGSNEGSSSSATLGHAVAKPSWDQHLLAFFQEPMNRQSTTDIPQQPSSGLSVQISMDNATSLGSTSVRAVIGENNTASRDQQIAEMPKMVTPTHLQMQQQRLQSLVNSTATGPVAGIAAVQEDAAGSDATDTARVDGVGVGGAGTSTASGSMVNSRGSRDTIQDMAERVQQPIAARAFNFSYKDITGGVASSAAAAAALSATAGIGHGMDCGSTDYMQLNNSASQYHMSVRSYSNSQSQQSMVDGVALPPGARMRSKKSLSRHKVIFPDSAILSAEASGPSSSGPPIAHGVPSKEDDYNMPIASMDLFELDLLEIKGPFDGSMSKDFAEFTSSVSPTSNRDRHHQQQQQQGGVEAAGRNGGMHSKQNSIGSFMSSAASSSLGGQSIVSWRDPTVLGPGGLGGNDEDDDGGGGAQDGPDEFERMLEALAKEEGDGDLGPILNTNLDRRANHRRQHSNSTTRSHNSDNSNLSRRSGGTHTTNNTNNTNKSGTKRFVHKQPQPNRKLVNNHYKDPKFRPSPAMDMLDSHSDLSSANNSGTETLELTAGNLRRLGSVSTLVEVVGKGGGSSKAGREALQGGPMPAFPQQPAAADDTTAVPSFYDAQFSFPTTYAPQANTAGTRFTGGGAFRQQLSLSGSSSMSKPPTPTGSYVSGYGADGRALSGTNSDLNYSGSNADEYQGQQQPLNSPVLAEMQAMNIQQGQQQPNAMTQQQFPQTDSRPGSGQLYDEGAILYGYSTQPPDQAWYQPQSQPQYQQRFEQQQRQLSSFEVLQQQMLAMEARDQQLMMMNQQQQQQPLQPLSLQQPSSMQSQPQYYYHNNQYPYQQQPQQPQQQQQYGSTAHPFNFHLTVDTQLPPQEPPNNYTPGGVSSSGGPTPRTQPGTKSSTSGGGGNSSRSRKVSAAAAAAANINQQDGPRGNYRCGRCGQPKVNHVCAFVDLVMASVATQVESPILQDFVNFIPHRSDRLLTVAAKRTTIHDSKQFDYQAHSAKFGGTSATHTLKQDSFVESDALIYCMETSTTSLPQQNYTNNSSSSHPNTNTNGITIETVATSTIATAGATNKATGATGGAADVEDGLALFGDIMNFSGSTDNLNMGCKIGTSEEQQQQQRQQQSYQNTSIIGAQIAANSYDSSDGHNAMTNIVFNPSAILCSTVGVGSGGTMNVTTAGAETTANGTEASATTAGGQQQQAAPNVACSTLFCGSSL